LFVGHTCVSFRCPEGKERWRAVGLEEVSEGGAYDMCKPNRIICKIIQMPLHGKLHAAGTILVG
jgi:hypothetical protein